MWALLEWGVWMRKTRNNSGSFFKGLELLEIYSFLRCYQKICVIFFLCSLYFCLVAGLTSQNSIFTFCLNNAVIFVLPLVLMFSKKTFVFHLFLLSFCLWAFISNKKPDCDKNHVFPHCSHTTQTLFPSLSIHTVCGSVIFFKKSAVQAAPLQTL